MSTYENTDRYGNPFRVATSENHDGHVCLTMLDNTPTRWFPNEDAPALALAILQAAECNRSGKIRLHAAMSQLDQFIEERAEREAEDAKVREFVDAIPGVSYLDESEDHWRHLYRAAREFFNRAEGTVTVPAYASDPGFEQLVDLASRAREESLKPAPRVLNYGDPEPDRDTLWRMPDGDVLDYGKCPGDPGEGWRWSNPNRGYGRPRPWEQQHMGCFPMTEVVGK